MVVTPQVTGSWDDEDNVVMVWSSGAGEAVLRSEARLPGEVTGLEWLGGKAEAGLVASTSAGTVTLFGLTGLQVCDHCGRSEMTLQSPRVCTPRWSGGTCTRLARAAPRPSPVTGTTSPRADRTGRSTSWCGTARVLSR